jgi:hypothetical protein
MRLLRTFFLENFNLPVVDPDRSANDHQAHSLKAGTAELKDE